MIPILYPPNETEFRTQGEGSLIDAVSCIVREARNGEYELEMQYPVTGQHYAKIRDRSLIWAIPSPYRPPQPFRVYRISKPLNGICTYSAHHISYDLSGIPVHPFSAVNAPDAMSAIADNAALPSPFTFWTDVEDSGELSVLVPTSSRRLLGGSEGSILSHYGGELEFDRFEVKLHSARGSNRGVKISYGKNLTDITQERNLANVATGIYPYWLDADSGTVVTCSPRIIQAPGTYNFAKVIPVDFSQMLKEQPSPDELKAAAEKYVREKKIGVPDVSINVSFVQLDQTVEYREIAALERCDLCDTVTVEFPPMGIDVTAEVAQITTNVLLDKYESVVVGSIRPNIADTIVGQREEIEHLKDPSTLQQAVNRATGWITGGGGYMVLVRDMDGTLREIVSLDEPDINAAKSVWRWNNGGFGHSSTGYNGPYKNAWTQDGHFVADFMDTGTLNAALVRIINLITDHFKSETDAGTIEIQGSNIALTAANGSDLLISFAGGLPYIIMRDRDSHGAVTSSMTIGQNAVRMGRPGDPQMLELATYSGQSHAIVDELIVRKRMQMGQNIIFDGTAAVGQSVIVPADGYNAFMIRLGTESSKYATPIFAYRCGNNIRGAGGQAGSSPTSRAEYHAVTIQVVDGKWKVINAKYYHIGTDGNWDGGTELRLKEVIALF